MLLIIFVVRTTKEYISTNYILPVAIYPTTTDVNKPKLLDMSNNQLQKCGPVAIQLLEAAKIKSSGNEYFHFVGYTFLQDSLPEIYMHFYDEITGTDPIYDNNKFTGYYWFGLERIGGYRVISAYTNAFAWTIEEKENAVIKNRVSCYSVILILLTICLILFLYFVKHSNRNKT